MHHMDDKLYASRREGNMLCKILILAVAVSLHPDLRRFVVVTASSSQYSIIKLGTDKPLLMGHVGVFEK